ncbi:MAG: EamA family transporter [Actinomycetota bacterium]|nr:EamA family transporter [Actinomycetota bacterium]
MSDTFITAVLLITSIGLAVFGQLAMKAGMNSVTNNGENPLRSSDFAHPLSLAKRVLKDGLWAIAGIMLYAISAVFWLIVLSRVSLSVAYPMVAAGYIAVVLYSKFVFKEEVRPLAWIGLVFIVIGVVITAQGLPRKSSEQSLRKDAVVRVCTDRDLVKK